MKYKLFLIIALVLVFYGALSPAQEQTLGTFRQNSCIELKQTCGNCTYVNITRISAPDSTILLSGQNLMTKTDTIYNRTFCNTTQLGQYVIDWKADPDGTTTAGNYDLFVTITGLKPTTAQGTIYFFLGFLSIIIFCLSLYGAVKIKWKHPRDMKGHIIGLNDLKYLKLFLWFFTYLMLIFITFAFKHVSQIADWDVAGNWFNFMFWFLIVGLLPTFILTCVLGFVSFMESKKLNDFFKRGIKVR